MDKAETIKELEFQYAAYAAKVRSDAEWHGIGPDIMDFEEFARHKGFHLDVKSILYEFSASSLWGGDEPEEEGIDAEASIEAYREALIDHLYDLFGDVDIEIEVVYKDTNRCLVNGQADHKLCMDVEAIADKVWHGDGWLIYVDEEDNDVDVH